MSNAWLFLAAGSGRKYGGNEGYEDDPDRFYSWDDTVSNGGKVRAGDIALLWNGVDGALGVSVIEEIEESTGAKQVNQCPKCKSSNLKIRTTGEAGFRCDKCKATFSKASTSVKLVTSRRSRHDAAWVDLQGRISPEQVRLLALSPKSQLSIRPANADLLSKAFTKMGLKAVLDGLRQWQGTGASIPSGHTEARVKVRRGQGKFREALLKKFGSVCAITGPQPAEVLEAAHLYSYAKLGAHEVDCGGLLLRRDVHRLFDLGLLCIDPDSERVQLSPLLAKFPVYGALMEAPLSVSVTTGHKQWFERHRSMWKSTWPSANQ